MVSLGLGLFLASASIVGANGATCTQPDTPAAVRSMPSETPALLQASGSHGIAQVIVTLTPQSAQPANVELVQSTGDAIVDAAAIEVARATLFVPETRDCNPVGGRYFYEFNV
ncbi:MAG: TonB family protein [Candidatus Eremiobacteraeota bacterium]|nr:TonB family protein [Candidatus Eremiobacteraeota bacterium]